MGDICCSRGIFLKGCVIISVSVLTVPIEVDLGFQGLQNEYVNIRIGHKKPRGGQLSETQKAENKALSRERVLCENAFAGVKRYNAVATIYRNRVSDFDERLMLIAAGLWNFYLDAA